ncbi:NmrA/HSCARG family protein [Microvirga sp. 3-52]|nr:NmrA/HSCARG family protein [Microvirga sp. 3-52]
MSKYNPSVLVVGATGRFAGLVVPELVRRGAAVRAFVRDPGKASIVRTNGAAEVAVGDLRDRQSLERALQGIDGVFHIGPAFVADEADLGIGVIEAAARSGVRKIAFSSVIHPTSVRLANHASKIPVEDAIFASGIDYTILHPAMFFQNIAGGWQSAIERGVFAEPFPIETRVARVDYRDVAEAAAIALTEDRLAFGTFELCAAMPDRSEIAAVMSDVVGRSIEPGEVGFDEWAANLPLSRDQKELLARVFETYAASGSGGNSLVLRAALGREPRSLHDYIKDLASTAS